MRVFRSANEVPPNFGPSVVTIGNFDGVHVGHREILRRVVAIAGRQNLRSAVLTFDPHPAKVLAPERAPLLILTVEQKLRRFEDMGIDGVLLLPFSAEFAMLTPEEFATCILADSLNARRVLVGDDFRFGHRQAGNLATLQDLGAALGFTLEPVAEITAKEARISSSAIRKLVSIGRVSHACRLLGGPFALTGPVVKGQGIGSKQTVPTLNLAAENELLPKTGVYVTRTRDLNSSREWNSITNVGYRPTFNGSGLTVENFLLSPFDGDTPTRIEVAFLAFIREERRFEGPELLKAQILRDARAAAGFHRRLARLHMA